MFKKIGPEHFSTIHARLMAWIVAPGRRVAQRDAGPSDKRRNASGASSRATEGRVLFVAGRVADRLKWGHTTARSAPNRRQKSARPNDRVWSKSALAAACLMVAGTAYADGIPSLRGGDHIGFTVPDLGQAVTFFQDVIGCESFYPLGPFADTEGTWMQDHLNVDPRAEIPAIRLMRCGHGNNLEIFQYSAPDQNKVGPRNSDIGGHHIAFYVDDINSAVDYLRAKDVKVLGDPTVMTGGPSGGEAWVYFLAPWGMQLELVSYPDGKAYESEYDGRLWAAGAPAD